jgi:hypothetical protein
MMTKEAVQEPDDIYERQKVVAFVSGFGLHILGYIAVDLT